MIGRKAGKGKQLLQLVLVLVLFPASGSAQTDSSVPLVLRLSPTVQSASLNGAAVALLGDAGSVFANPAGLATIRRVAFGGWFRSMPSDEAFVASGAFAWRLRQFDLGVGVRMFDLGANPGVYLGPGIAAGQDVREALGVGSLVYRFGMLAFGASAKYVRRTMDAAEEQAVGADVGMAIAIFDIMALAFSVQNLRGNWYESSALRLPRLSRLGFTMNYVDPQESLRLLSTLEVQWPEGEGARFVVGLEGGVVIGGVGVLGRIGVGSRLPVSGRSKATFGATLAFTHLHVDYAYRQIDLLDQPAHQFGVRVRL